jgi:hypothetical protein
VNSLAKTLLAQKEPGTRVLYGVATANNTVTLAGSTVAVELPALEPVVSGDYVAVLATGADRLILGAIRGEDMAWTAAPTFGTGWGNYGSGWAEAEYRKVGDEVQLRGLIYRSSSTDHYPFTMPSGFRPPAHMAFPCMGYVGANLPVRISVYASGELELDTTNAYPSVGAIGTAAVSYLDLSTIRFSVAA